MILALLCTIFGIIWNFSSTSVRKLQMQTLQFQYWILTLQFMIWGIKWKILTQANHKVSSITWAFCFNMWASLSLARCILWWAIYAYSPYLTCFLLICFAIWTWFQNTAVHLMVSFLVSFRTSSWYWKIKAILSSMVLQSDSAFNTIWKNQIFCIKIKFYHSKKCKVVIDCMSMYISS